MVLAAILLIAAAGGAQSAAAQTSACGAAVSAAADRAAVEICAGDEATRAAEAAPKDSARRTAQFELAADHFRRAVNLSNGDARIRAINLLISVYDPQRLNAPERMEQALRELLQLTPADLTVMYRLARLQEQRGFIDAAEELLLSARRQRPDEVEPYQMLAQFYVRRVTALNKQVVQAEAKASTGPGERDKDGIYRVGGPIAQPSRLDVAKYPNEAQAAGIQGAVVAEIVLDEAGNVVEAKILNSIPLLDEPALAAVRNWHFAPTVVNGQPVPVRTNVTVNFTLR